VSESRTGVRHSRAGGNPDRGILGSRLRGNDDVLENADLPENADLTIRSSFSHSDRRAPRVDVLLAAAVCGSC
jgi:hypothetical protein